MGLAFFMDMVRFDHRLIDASSDNRANGIGENTDIYFDPATESVFVDRSRSTSVSDIRKSSEQAPHTLFEFAGSPGDETIDKGRTLEDLEFHVFYDCSILEVFVNQRTAISTRVYPISGASIGLGIIGVPGEYNRTELRQCSLWPLESRNVSTSH